MSTEDLGARPIPVVLDTDIGSDVDDVQALLMVLASPELELVGVTASYGDTLLRARLVKQICDWVGVDVPIGAGPTTTLSGRDVWVAGHEESQLRDGPARAFAPVDAVDLLVDLSRDHAGRLQVIAVAPQTTLAAALRSHSDIAGRLAGLTVMGGRFEAARPEHNIECDAVAASEVFAAGIPTRVVGVDVTVRTRIPRARFSELGPGTGPLDTFVREVHEQWTAFTGEPFSIPHDPLAVALLTRPSAFEFERGHVAVTTDGPAAGRTVFTAGPGHVERVVSHADLTDHVVARIAAPHLRSTGGTR